jgi:hypothetical protein
MTTILMDMDGCDIAHESLLLSEFYEQVKYAGREPQLALATVSSMAKSSRHAYAPIGARTFNIDFPSSVNEVGDSVSLFLSSAFPKCP